MKEQASELGNLRNAPRAQRRSSDTDSGIEVREEQLCSITMQLMYKMRCECGRSWFELEPKNFVHCPACQRLGLVSA